MEEHRLQPNEGAEFLQEAAEGTEKMTSEEQQNRHWILHEATEGTEEMTFPLITSLRQGSGWQARIDADRMIRSDVAADVRRLEDRL